MPGVVALRALPGRGVWRGRAGGEAVDVVVVVVPPDPDRRRATLAMLTPLVGPAHGCIPQCRAAVLCRAGVALVTDAVDGTSLNDLPSLRVGHAVHVGRTVAQALSAHHARGLAWGGDLGELLVDGSGTVWLPWEAVVARRVAAVPATATEDVQALVSLLTARCRDPRLAALVVHPPPDARALARRLRRIARPRALVLVAGGSPDPVRQGGSRRRPRTRGRRTAVVAVAAVAAVAGAASVGWASVRPHDPRGATTLPLAVPAPTATVRQPTTVRSPVTVSASAGGRSPAALRSTASMTSPATILHPAGAGAGAGAGSGSGSGVAAATDWRAVLAALDLARSQALMGAGPLAAADAPGSAAFIADARIRATLVDRHLQVVVPTPTLLAVIATASTTGASTTAASTTAASTTATVVVRDSLAGYSYRDAGGQVVDTVPPRGPRTWRIQLIRAPADWRIATVSAG